MMDAGELLALKQLRESSVPFDMGAGARAVFHIRAIPRKEYRTLLDEHPPRPGTEDKDWNEDSFPPALISRCVTSIEYTKDGNTEKVKSLEVDEAQQMWDEWEAGFVRIVNACWELNESAVGVGFTWPGFDKIVASGLKSATAPNTESPTPSS